MLWMDFHSVVNAGQCAKIDIMHTIEGMCAALNSLFFGITHGLLDCSLQTSTNYNGTCTVSKWSSRGQLWIKVWKMCKNNIIHFSYGLCLVLLYWSSRQGIMYNLQRGWLNIFLYDIIGCVVSKLRFV